MTGKAKNKASQLDLGQIWQQPERISQKYMRDLDRFMVTLINLSDGLSLDAQITIYKDALRIQPDLRFTPSYNQFARKNDTALLKDIIF
ncbi:MAG: hypothetical protein ACR2HL_06290 [Methylocystis sp.]|jgi:hypothetical protein